MPSKNETNETKTDHDDPGCCNIEQGCTSKSFLCIGLSKVKDILDRAFTLIRFLSVFNVKL